VEGAQGVLTQPEWVRGCEHTTDSLPRCVGKASNVERLIRKSWRP
jgi:hypothetical protein